MKPVIASKSTTCAKCGDKIERGSQRLDDVIRLRGRVGEPRYRRIHYHKDCFTTKIEEYFLENTEPFSPAGATPKLYDLSPDERKYRKNILSSLSALKSYYKDKIAFIIQKDPEKIDHQDVRTLRNFHFRFYELLRELKATGGLPPNYQSIDLSRIEDLITTIGELVDKPDWGLEGSKDSTIILL